MFIGHYAVAMSAAAFTREKGAFTLVAVSSACPDILMLSLNPARSSLNFHADIGLLACISITLVFGFLLQVSKKVYLLSFLAMLLHLPLDFPYVAQDASNWYANSQWDFALEVGMLIGGAALYLYKQRLTKSAMVAFLTVCFSIISLQGIWNFIVGF